MKYRLIKIPIEKAIDDECFHMHRCFFSSNDIDDFWSVALTKSQSVNKLLYSVLEFSPRGFRMVSLVDWIEENENE